MPRGRKPTPVEVLKLRGSRIPKGRAVFPLPDRLKGAPDPPPWLSDEALAHWQELVPELAKHDLCCKLDARPLARLCSMLARWDRLDDQLEREGVTVTYGDPARDHVHPLYRVLVGLEKQIDALRAEFGMTPASRQRLKGHCD